MPVFGGNDPAELWKKAKKGELEIVVGTPGRIIEMIKKKAFNLDSRCTFCVIDEADRMFSLGFEYQIRTILSQLRPIHQTLLFSATFQSRIQSLCEDQLKPDFVKIVIGKQGFANEDISQSVLVFKDQNEKISWLI